MMTTSEDWNALIENELQSGAQSCGRIEQPISRVRPGEEYSPSLQASTVDHGFSKVYYHPQRDEDISKTQTPTRNLSSKNDNSSIRNNSQESKLRRDNKTSISNKKKKFHPITMETIFAPLQWSRYIDINFPDEHILCGLSMDEFLSEFIGTPHPYFKLEKTKVIVKAPDETTSKRLLDLRQIGNVRVKATDKNHLNQREGTILVEKFLPKPGYSEEWIKEKIKKVFTRRNHNIEKVDIYQKPDKFKSKNLTFAKITFNQHTIPSEIWFANRRIEIREVLPKPMLCNRCLEFGHTYKRCNINIQRCHKCGLTTHSNKDCKSKLECFNCGGEHSVFSNNCPKFRIRQEILIRCKQYGLNWNQAKLDMKAEGKDIDLRPWNKVVAANLSKSVDNQTQNVEPDQIIPVTTQEWNNRSNQTSKKATYFQPPNFSNYEQQSQSPHENVQITTNVEIHNTNISSNNRFAALSKPEEPNMSTPHSSQDNTTYEPKSPKPRRKPKRPRITENLSDDYPETPPTTKICYDTNYLAAKESPSQTNITMRETELSNDKEKQEKRRARPKDTEKPNDNYGTLKNNFDRHIENTDLIHINSERSQSLERYLNNAKKGLTHGINFSDNAALFRTSSACDIPSSETTATAIPKNRKLVIPNLSNESLSILDERRKRSLSSGNSTNSSIEKNPIKSTFSRRSSSKSSRSSLSLHSDDEYSSPNTSEEEDFHTHTLHKSPQNAPTLVMEAELDELFGSSSNHLTERNPNDHTTKVLSCEDINSIFNSSTETVPFNASPEKPSRQTLNGTNAVMTLDLSSDTARSHSESTKLPTTSISLLDLPFPPGFKPTKQIPETFTTQDSKIENPYKSSTNLCDQAPLNSSYATIENPINILSNHPHEELNTSSSPQIAENTETLPISVIVSNRNNGLP